MNMETLYPLGEADKGLGESDLPEHSVARGRPFLRCVEEDVRLFLGIFIVSVNLSSRVQRWVIDGQIEEIGRQPGHVPRLEMIALLSWSFSRLKPFHVPFDKVCIVG